MHKIKLCDSTPPPAVSYQKYFFHTKIKWFFIIRTIFSHLCFVTIGALWFELIYCGDDRFSYRTGFFPRSAKRYTQAICIVVSLDEAYRQTTRMMVLLILVPPIPRDLPPPAAVRTITTTEGKQWVFDSPCLSMMNYPFFLPAPQHQSLHPLLMSRNINII